MSVSPGSAHCGEGSLADRSGVKGCLRWTCADCNHAERIASMRVPLSWLKDFVDITVPLDDLDPPPDHGGVGGRAMSNTLGPIGSETSCLWARCSKSNPIPMPSGWCWRRWTMATARRRRWSPARPICGRASAARKWRLRSRGPSCSMAIAPRHSRQTPHAHHHSWGGIGWHGLL